MCSMNTRLQSMKKPAESNAEQACKNKTKTGSDAGFTERAQSE